MARQRINRILSTEMVAMYSMVGAAFGGREGHSNFKKLLKRLEG